MSVEVFSSIPMSNSGEDWQGRMIVVFSGSQTYYIFASCFSNTLIKILVSK